MGLFETLLAELEYLKPAQIERIRQAYQFANIAHQGQKRYTGDPYIAHPVAVAIILAKFCMDYQTIMAALLHDVLEDTCVEQKTLVRKFGKTVGRLTDGVSKLAKIKFKSRLEAQAENFRKMLFAMSNDIRVILIKLADRLHNMRTLEALPIAKRRRISRETLEIFAPIAKRLGMHDVCIELGELGFKYLYPYRYQVLQAAVNRVQGSRTPILEEILQMINKMLRKSGIKNYCVLGRRKHLYSLYKKMRDKKMLFSEITDVYGVRIILDEVNACYLVLGLVHSLYKPVAKRFKDYIAIPKANGYQSLHTLLFGPYGVLIEAQIRTNAMDHLANDGVAAHWSYKSDNKFIKKSHILSQQWLKSLLDIQSSTGNSLEFIENVKIDLFPDEVYVFTPKGGILELPAGATPIDFAYAVHTEVGNTCIQARVDRQLVPLSSVLSNGQTVEIITSPHASPNPDWLNDTVTSKAHSSIREYIKRCKRTESIALGKRLMDKALQKLGVSLEQVPKTILDFVLEEISFDHLEDLFEDMGLGNRSAVLTAERIRRPLNGDKKDKLQDLSTSREDEQPLIIKGTERMVVNFARCCHPIPGDPIVGFLKPGFGISVHTDPCVRIGKLRQTTDKCMPLRWAECVEGDFLVPIQVSLVNQSGTLAQLTAAISVHGGNVDNIKKIGEVSRGARSLTFCLDLLVQGRDHLAAIIRSARRVGPVIRIARVKRSVEDE